MDKFQGYFRGLSRSWNFQEKNPGLSSRRGNRGIMTRVRRDEGSAWINVPIGATEKAKLKVVKPLPASPPAEQAAAAGHVTSSWSHHW